MDDQEEVEYEDNNMNYGEDQYNQRNDVDEKEDAPQDPLAAAGLEDSDADDDEVTLSLSLCVFVYICI